MKRILILYADGIGKGHKSAAKALVKAFEEQSDVVEEVRMEDALNYGSSFYRKLYAEFYRELSENMPELWEQVYQLADNNDTRFVNELRILLDRIGVNELNELVTDFNPDAIICTHFMPLHVLGWYKNRGLIKQPLYATVTDYTGHNYWVHPNAEAYFVASDNTKKMMIERGVPENQIQITGIPIDPAIAELKDNDHLRQRYEITQPPVVTLIGSALSVPHVKEIVTGLRDVGMNGTLFVVAGRNDELLAELKDETSTPELDMRILGFVDYLDDLVAASDLIITKAGGLVVSEIMARGTPMVMIDPIRGQEEWNADYVVSVGAGVQLRKATMVPTVVQQLITDSQRLEMLQSRAEEAGQPFAAYNIAQAILAANQPIQIQTTLPSVQPLI